MNVQFDLKGINGPPLHSVIKRADEVIWKGFRNGLALPFSGDYRLEEQVHPPPIDPSIECQGTRFVLVAIQFSFEGIRASSN